MKGSARIGDYGTVYQVPIYDGPVNFDPSLATLKKLIFVMPNTSGGFTTLERVATAAQVSIDGVDVWCLTYTVLPADVATEFHVAAGPITIQGLVEFGATQRWRGSLVGSDLDGRALEVVANL